MFRGVRQSMILKSKCQEGKIDPDENTSTDDSQERGDDIVIEGGGVLNQVSVIFDGGSPAARSSQLAVEYDGSKETYPDCNCINRSHGEDKPGTTLANIIHNNRLTRKYGYYIVLDSEFENRVEIILENGDKNKSTNYRCLVLYHQERGDDS